MNEIAAGYVHRHPRQCEACVAPLAQIAAHPLYRPTADVADQTGLLGDGDEIARRDLSAFGVEPAQQRLPTQQAQAAGFVLRLVVHLETAILDGPPQFDLQREPLHCPRVHRAVEHPQLIASVRFRLGHRAVGVLEQALRVGPVFRKRRDADARSHHQFIIFPHERSGQDRQNPLRGVLRVPNAGVAGKYDQELIAAHTRQLSISPLSQKEPYHLC